jgi:hypothetical protein
MFPRTPAALYPPDPRSALAHFTQTFKREQLELDRCCPQHLWRTHTEGVGTVGQVCVRLWRGAALKSPPSRLHFERGVRFREERERRHPDIHLRSHGTTQSSLFQISFAPNPNQRAAHACGSSSASPKWPICLLISGGGVINCCGSAAIGGDVIPKTHPPGAFSSPAPFANPAASPLAENRRLAFPRHVLFAHIAARMCPYWTYPGVVDTFPLRSVPYS